MKIIFTERFQSEFDRLPSKSQERVIAVIEQLPSALGAPHRHAGIGLRKIHRSGIFEARIGLNLRVVFTQEKQQLIVHRVGDHEFIRRYLRQL